MTNNEKLFQAASNVVNNYFKGTNTTGRNYSDDMYNLQEVLRMIAESNPADQTPPSGGRMHPVVGRDPLNEQGI